MFWIPIKPKYFLIKSADHTKYQTHHLKMKFCFRLCFGFCTFYCIPNANLSAHSYIYIWRCSFSQLDCQLFNIWHMLSTPCNMRTFMHNLNAHHSAIFTIKWHKPIVRRTKSTMHEQLRNTNSFYIPISLSLLVYLRKIDRFFFICCLCSHCMTMLTFAHKNNIMNGEWAMDSVA